MANTLFTPGQSASVAAALLFGDLSIAGTFSRDVEADFGGGSGSTVYVRVPSALPGRTRAVGSTAPITVDSLNEINYPVSLSEQVYNAVEITDAERTLEIGDFASRVLVPQTQAVRGQIERAAIDALEAIVESNALTDAPAYDPLKPHLQFSALRKKFRGSGVDAETPLVAIVGTGVYGDLMDADLRKGLDAPAVGAFEIVESDKIDDGAIFAFAKPAMVMAVRAPSAPEGAGHAASKATDAGAVLHVMGYSLETLMDRSVVSTFVGASEVPLYVVSEAGVRTQVPGAYFLDTATAPA